MRIGILTLPLHTNYGGILQAYALQTILERQGHEVVVFQRDYDSIRKIPFYIYPFVLLKRMIWKLFVDYRTVVFFERKRKKELPIVRRNTNDFINKYIHIRLLNRLTDISPSEVDAIVVGSDQIWRKKYVKQIWLTNVQDVFLKFASSWPIIRIAYAASFGSDTWEYNEQETTECKRLAELFNAISVREDSGVKLCENMLGVKVRQLIDPTLLLEKKDYITLMGNKYSDSNDRGLFNYILDETPEKLDFIDRVSKERNIKPYSIVMYRRDRYVPLEQRILPPVEKWLSCFNDANFVVTDSFHGCVFSIIFGKPFVAIGNAKRGLSRFLSLFNVLGLEKHLLIDINDYSPDSSYKLPDDLSLCLKTQRESSLQYLQNALLGHKQ